MDKKIKLSSEEFEKLALKTAIDSIGGDCDYEIYLYSNEYKEEFEDFNEEEFGDRCYELIQYIRKLLKDTLLGGK